MRPRTAAAPRRPRLLPAPPPSGHCARSRRPSDTTSGPTSPSASASAQCRRSRTGGRSARRRSPPCRPRGGRGDDTRFGGPVAAASARHGPPSRPPPPAADQDHRHPAPRCRRGDRQARPGTQDPASARRDRTRPEDRAAESHRPHRTPPHPSARPARPRAHPGQRAHPPRTAGTPAQGRKTRPCRSDRLVPFPDLEDRSRGHQALIGPGSRSVWWAAVRPGKGRPAAECGTVSGPRTPRRNVTGTFPKGFHKRAPAGY